MELIHPGLLWGLGLVALPVVIHLLNRRRFVVVRWAPMELLLQAHHQNRRRIRIEHWLLLLLRCLAVALIVLAVARPRVGGGGLSVLGAWQEQVERVVLLDDSGSMGASSGDQTAIARAHTAAAQWVAALERDRPRDLLTVALASRPGAPEVIQAPLGSERALQALEHLSAAEPTGRRLDLLACLEPLLKPPAAGAPQRRVVTVLTDLRAADWLGPDGRTADALAAAVRGAVEEVGGPGRTPWLQVVVVDVGAPLAANLAVTALEPVGRLALVGSPLELEVRVRNDGDAAVRGVPLTLETPTGQVPLPPIEAIAPGEEATVRAATVLRQVGATGLAVRLARKDPQPIDDARFLALEVRERVRLLLVDGDPHPGPLQGETDLLRLALAPPGDGVTSGVDPVVIPPERLAEEALSGYAGVVLANVAHPTTDDGQALRRYVAGGGGLAIFLGDHVDPDAYEAALGGANPATRLLPGAIGELRQAASAATAPPIAAPEGDHPLTRVFAGEGNPFLARVRASVWRAWSLDPARDAAARVLLRLTDPARTPFLLERPVGAGRVVLFNTTADLAGSSWPRSPSFPVLAQELARRLTPAAAAGRAIECGQPLEWTLDLARVAPTVALRVPGDPETRRLHAEAQGGVGRVVYPQTNRPGLYALTLRRLEDGAAVTEQVAVDADPAEGLPERASLPRLEAACADLPVAWVAGGQADRDWTADETPRVELWRACLFALLLALMGEQLLALRAAHHGGRS